VRKSLEAPLRQLVDNAGMEGSLVVEEVKAHKGSYGYNVLTRQYGDLVQDGVLDPAKVVRYELQNAASIAALMLTTECMVTDIPEKKQHPLPGGGGYEGGMDEDY
jgi:chaperonin GroEL